MIFHNLYGLFDIMTSFDTSRNKDGLIYVLNAPKGVPHSRRYRAPQMQPLVRPEQG